MVCDCFLVLSSLQRWFSEYSMSSARVAIDLTRVAIDLRWYFFKTYMVQYNDSTGNEVLFCLSRGMYIILSTGKCVLFFSRDKYIFIFSSFLSSQLIIILDANVMAGKRVRSSSNFFASYIVLTILFGFTCHPYILEYTQLFILLFLHCCTILPPLATSLSTG